jgi:hypothetical protein
MRRRSNMALRFVAASVPVGMEHVINAQGKVAYRVRDLSLQVPREFL